MGDSTGFHPGFENSELDIVSAEREFKLRHPSINRLILIGLCDGATAAAFAAGACRSVYGVILLNPWVRTPQSEARTYFKHYYFKRLFERNFWKKVLKGEWSAIASARTIKRYILNFFRPANPNGDSEETLVTAMGRCLQQANVIYALGLSKDDAIAHEFYDLSKNDDVWREMRATSCKAEHWIDADHTFSSKLGGESLVQFVKDSVKLISVSGESVASKNGIVT